MNTRLLTSSLVLIGMLALGGCTPSPEPATQAPIGQEPPISPATDVPPGDAPRVCTLIGCEDALTVALTGSVPSQYTVELVETGGETITFACEDGQLVAGSYHSSLYGDDMMQPGMRAITRCQADQFEGSPGFYVGSFTPEDVTITITWEGGTASHTLAPQYTVLQPNGPGCEPICYQATITLQVGG